MCGICGIVEFAGRGDQGDLHAGVSKMVERLIHRGPDGTGIAEGSDAVLGATRLAIRGIDDGDQPLVDRETGIIVVCNGEIDNHQELRALLAERGRVVEHATDVAVIPALYLEFGERFAERLVGAFAVAIWDPRQRTLILARDRAGERPLFYARCGDRLVFASELAALVATECVEPRPNRQALAAYLQFGYLPGSDAPLADIKFLQPGRVATVTAQTLEVRRYWQWRDGIDKRSENSLDEFDAVFRNAVLKQSEVDVDFGIFLSGGVDSSLVAAVTRNIRPSKRLNAYSLRFHEASYDEGDFAEQIADSLGAEFIPVWVSPQDFPPMLSELIRLTGVPLADPAWIPSTLLARRARQDIRVALVGEGADELFGGYPTYVGAKFAESYFQLPSSIRYAVKWAVDHWPASDKKVTLSYLLKRFVMGEGLDGVERHQVWVSSVQPGLLARLGVQCAHGFVPVEAGGSLLDRVQSFDLENYLAEGLLTKADRSGMSQGLELRAPFLDQAVMDFAATLSERERLKGIQTKAFLKRYALRYLPASVVHRRKRGLSVPLSTWLREELHDWARQMLESGGLESVGVSTEAALEMLEEHRCRRADHARALWTLIVLSEWLNWQQSLVRNQA